MVDIVRAEAGAHQLLEEIGLLVRALGRAEAGERLAALLVADAVQAACREIERLLPGGFAEMGPGIGGIDLVARVLGHVGQAHQWLGQPVRVMDVIEAEAALDAEPVAVGRAVAALGIDDLLVLDVVGDLAADAAIGAERIDLPVGPDGARLVLVEEGGGHQRAGRAGLDAFAAGDAGRLTHRVVEIEDDLGAGAAIGHADHVVDLDLAAGPHAQATLDAGVEIDAHRGVADIRAPALGRGEAAFGDAGPLGPVPEFRGRIVRGLARRLVGDEQLHHHLAGLLGPLGPGMDLHPDRRLAHARGGEHALALDLDHAGAAIAVGPVVGLRRVAEMRDRGAQALRHLPDRLIIGGLDALAIQFEADALGHSAASLVMNSSGK